MSLLSIFRNKRKKNNKFSISTFALCGLTYFIFALQNALALPVETKQAATNQCQASQSSSKTLPILESNCPIGVGLWGGIKPKQDDGMFWIQCGVYSTPLSLEQAKVLYNAISTDVWLQVDKQNTYRCLIGPYFSFNTAEIELERVKDISAYKHAEIRQVRNHQGTLLSPQTSNSLGRNSSQNSTKLRQTLPDQDITETTNTNQLSTLMGYSQSAQTIVRRKAKIGALSFAVPYKRSPKLTFYMENQQAWNRLSYQDAKSMCQSLEMHLLNKMQWEVLFASNVIKKDQWPSLLPYWGDNMMGFFPNTGQSRILKDSSLLNVMCVK